MNTYETKCIDTAAYLSTCCGVLPEIHRDQFDGQAVFSLDHTPEIQAALVEYATGAALVPARRLLGTRRKLYYAVRRVTGGHHV